MSDVSGMAGRMTYRLATLRLPGLSEEAVERIMERTENPLFAWQDRAAAALETARRTSQRPALVLNLAGTGAGKTRMNAKCACALAGERPVRFATALNLRTLTLQTGDAYREQLGIGPDELACVIGDAIATRLHESARQQETAEFADEDENPVDVEFESVGEAFFVPDWVEPFVKKKPRMRLVIGAPVLASTVDFLIAAGEPHRQGNHTLALLRLVDSDLILDEIDSYDPKAMVAVLRLVQMAGLFGRNVISSSATLARPVATALCRAYRSGIAMRAALEGQAEPSFLCALIDDRLDPEVFICKEPGEFATCYDARIARLLAAGLRFRDHPFARLDDENLTRMIEAPLKILCMEARPRDWMVEATYADYPLRDKQDHQQTWRFNYEEDQFELFAPTRTGDPFIPRSDLVDLKRGVPANAWLSWSNAELAKQAFNAGLSLADAFRFTVSGYGLDARGFEWDEAFGACSITTEHP
ncbi:MAG: hypothetical protein R6X17_14755 [Candidatus Competibacteraceae bacterium]